LLIRVAANLAYSKPEFESLASFEHLCFFLEIKKSQAKVGFFLHFFSQKGLALAKDCLSCIFITNLI